MSSVDDYFKFLLIAFLDGCTVGACKNLVVVVESMVQ